MLLPRPTRPDRPGAVVVELAVILPLIVFLALVGVDFARIFSRSLILETASRNACIYAAQDPGKAADQTAIRAVALKDLTDVQPTPTVTSSTYTGADGFQYVKVTVSMTFTTISNYPGVPTATEMHRSTVMRICPTTPKPGTY
jgi:Flp pilus assembly protein TadG